MSYDWLNSETAPRILVQAVKRIGVKEVVGKEHNPIILSWARELKLSSIYNADEIPWCGLFIAYCCYAANIEIASKPLWALSWANWGTAVTEPMLGDVLTFKRNGGGHVGLYVGEDKTHFHVLGGNQNNEVNVVRIAKTRLFKARRTASNAVRLVKNTTHATSSVASTAKPNLFFLFGARSIDLSNTTIQNSSRQIAFGYLSDGFTQTECDNLYTAVQAYQTTLSRQV